MPNRLRSGYIAKVPRRVQVLRMQAFRPVFHLKLDLLSFFSVCILPCRSPRNEQTRPARRHPGSRTVALGIVEPLYDTGGHKHSSEAVFTTMVLTSFRRPTGRTGQIMNLLHQVGVYLHEKNGQTAINVVYY